MFGGLRHPNMNAKAEPLVGQRSRHEASSPAEGAQRICAAVNSVVENYEIHNHKYLDTAGVLRAGVLRDVEKLFSREKDRNLGEIQKCLAIQGER